MTEAAFKKNILPLNRKLLGFASSFMKNLDEAKDIVQEIYIKLWNMKDELEKYNSVEALAMRMTRNLCLDKIKLKKTIPLDEHLQNKVEKKGGNDDKQQKINIAVHRVKEIIDNLDEPQKSIIKLKDIQGYDYEEIAAILNMNVNTIRVSLSRTRKRVRELLINKYYNYGNKEDRNTVRKVL